MLTLNYLTLHSPICCFSPTESTKYTTTKDKKMRQSPIQAEPTLLPTYAPSIGDDVT